MQLTYWPWLTFPEYDLRAILILLWQSESLNQCHDSPNIGDRVPAGIRQLVLHWKAGGRAHSARLLEGRGWAIGVAEQ